MSTQLPTLRRLYLEGLLATTIPLIFVLLSSSFGLISHYVEVLDLNWFFNGLAFSLGATCFVLAFVVPWMMIGRQLLLATFWCGISGPSVPYWSGCARGGVIYLVLPFCAYARWYFLHVAVVPAKERYATAFGMMGILMLILGAAVLHAVIIVQGRRFYQRMQEHIKIQQEIAEIRQKNGELQI